MQFIEQFLMHKVQEHCSVLPQILIQLTSQLWGENTQKAYGSDLRLLPPLLMQANFLFLACGDNAEWTVVNQQFLANLVQFG